MNIMFLQQVKLEAITTLVNLQTIFRRNWLIGTDIKQPARELMKLVTASQLYSFVPQW